MPGHVHVLVAIPPKINVSSFTGYLKGLPMPVDRRTNMEHKLGRFLGAFGRVGAGRAHAAHALSPGSLCWQGGCGHSECNGAEKQNPWQHLCLEALSGVVVKPASI